MKTSVRKFLTDERGQDLVEYSLLLVLLGSIALIFLTEMGINVANILSKIGNKLEGANNSIP